METTRRTCTLREIGIGLLALIASIAIGMFAVGGLGAPEANAAPDPVVVVDSGTGLVCPEGATGYPTAVDPTCTVISTDALVDALEG